MTLNWAQSGIDPSKVSGGKSICPKCSHERKNQSEKCLSVDLETGLYNCHHCGYHGIAVDRKRKEYAKPVPRLEKLGQKALKFFEESRKISNNTLLRFGVTEAKEWMPQYEKEVDAICFNYLRDEQLVNIKFRAAGKAFKMAKDAELIFYNLDAITDSDECLIVEGEIDAMSVHESGYFPVVSVPNGASKGNQKLDYLDNCWEYFAGKKKVILMTDNDEAGLMLRDELARRIGRDKCWRVRWPENRKDANEVLVKDGKQAVIDLIASAVQWPLDGILSVDELADDVINYFEHGYPPGMKLQIPELDELLQWAEGQLTMVTGIPGSGKSEFVDLIMVHTAKYHNWSWAVCSFETQPSSLHVTKLQEKFTGKAFGFRKNHEHRMTQSQFEHSLISVADHFHFMNIDEVDVTIDGLLDKAKQLVVRYGIKGLMIDPYNYIDHKIPKGYTETQYISELLSKIKRFGRLYGCHVILIAHPTKMQKENGKYVVPTLYHIAGSSHFFNKTDNGLCIYRDFETNLVDVYVQKVKHSWWGKIGYCSFNYDTNTRQYVPIGGITDEQTDPLRTVGWWAKD